MTPEFALRLVPILQAYTSFDELRELAAMFRVELESLHEDLPRWLSVARELSENIAYGNTRRLIEELVQLIDRRNDDGIANTRYESQQFHQGMGSAIRSVREMLAGDFAPSEIAVPAGKVFTAKSLVRDLLETAAGPLLIVDPYIGAGTLDCLRGVEQPLKLLTGTRANAVESGFADALAAFIVEGRTVQVRQGASLHDRHIVFNNRCWLVGGSLKDAGKKPFHCMEIVDQRSLVVSDLEERWAAATPYSS